MTTSEVASLLGCSANHVRHLIRSGKLSAKRIEVSVGVGWVYSISRADAERMAKKPQTIGYPRGRRRA